MNTVTLTEKEYKELRGAKRRLDVFLKSLSTRGRKGFIESAFGVLKNSYGKKSSASYVSKMRKAWRT